MRLDELLLKEMPLKINQEMDDDPDTIPFTTFFRTTASMREVFTLIAEHDNLIVYLKHDKSTAFIGTPDTRHDGAKGVLILGQLLFKSTLNLGSLEKQTFSPNVLQVELVMVNDRLKRAGVGTFLYSSLVRKGYTIISDNKQYDGGQALWQKIARSHASNEAVYVLDHGKLMLKDGQPIEYDGSNIPADELWSETDKLKQYILFVYTRK